MGQMTTGEVEVRKDVREKSAKAASNRGPLVTEVGSEDIEQTA